MFHRWLPRAVRFLVTALVVRAVSSSQTAWTNFVKDRLRETGLFSTVDDIDMGISNPAAATLAQYKLVVAISSSYGISDGDASGNAFGSYMAMRADGSVLVFLPYTWQTGISFVPPLGGSFLANNALFNQTATAATAAAKLGMTVNGDPLTAGVASFDCGSDCRRLTGIMPKAGVNVAAYWDDGTPLAARGRNRVDLNMYPADDSVITGSWKAGGRQLVTNSILFLAGAVTATPPSVAFPAAPLGLSSAPVNVTFRNGSRSAVQITTLGIDGAAAGAFSFTALQTPTVANPVIVAPGDTFVATVTFKPQSPGTQAASLFINVVGLGRVSVPLSGDSRGNLLVTGAPVDFGGWPLGGQPMPIRVTLKNVGASPISLTSAPTIGNTMQYTLTPVLMGATYPLALAPGSTYRFDVAFNPGMMAGQYNTSILVNSTDVLNPLTIPVTGLAGPPALQVQYSSLVLPDAAVNGRGLPLNVLLTNTGNSDLVLSDIVSDSMDFLVTKPNNLTIKARASTVFQLTFTPKQAGLRTGTVTLSSNEPPPAMQMNSNKTIAVSGTGTTPQFRLSTDRLDLGTTTIGQAATASFAIINDGDGDLTVTGVSVQAGMNSGSFSVGQFPVTVRSQGRENVFVTCNPRVAGSLTAKVTVTTNLMAMGTAEVTLTCTANGAITDISPKAVAFGAQKLNATGTKQITISNSGNQAVNITGVTLSQMGSEFAITGPKQGDSVAAAGMQSYNVTFKAGMVGAFTATLTISTDDPTTQRFVIQLTGSGVTGSVDISPTTLNFPPLYVGQTSSAQAVTVRNIGTTAIDKLEALPPSGPMAEDAAAFRQMGMYKDKLMPGESTDIPYVFAPRVAKDGITAQVIIRADGIDQMAKVNLGGSALSPVLNIRPSTVDFGNVIKDATAMPVEVVLSSSGANKLTVDVADPTDPQFTLTDADGNLLTGSISLEQDKPVKLLAGFKPTSLGSKSATVTMRIKGTDIELGTLNLKGEGTPPKTDNGGGGGCAVTPRADLSGFAAPGLLLALGLLLRRRRRA